MKNNIVFFVESMNCGGAERSLLSLLNTIDKSKYNIDLLVIKKGGEFEKFIPENINYKSTETKFGLLGRIKFNLYKRILSKRHKAQFFWKAFKIEIPEYTKSYDVAIAWGQGYATYYTSTKIKAIKKYAWINTDYERAGYNIEYDKIIYSKFDTLVGISEFVKGIMQKLLPFQKIIVVPNIIDNKDVMERSKEEIIEKFDFNKTNLVSVGRLANYKAFDLSVEAARILNKKTIDFCWYVIGEGTERNYLEALIEKYQLKSKFILLGFRDNPYPYIKHSDIYVQTSSFEGLGRTLIEAAILCKPIVTTNFPTAYNLVQDKQTGFITEMKAEDIAVKIELLINDKKVYNQMVAELVSKNENNLDYNIEHFYKLID